MKKTSITVLEVEEPKIMVKQIIDNAQNIISAGQHIQGLISKHAMYSKMVKGVADVPDAYIELKLDENYADCTHGSKVELRDLLILGIQAQQAQILKEIDKLQEKVIELATK